MKELYLGAMYEEVEVDGEVRRLRQGFTTGTCAAAAAKAAILALTGHAPLTEVPVVLPSHARAHVPVAGWRRTPEGIECQIIKDGGDDPDATHGALVCAAVSFRTDRSVVLDGGEGVGRVTKPGLGLAVGTAAINRVPRKMILDEALAIQTMMGGQGQRGLNIVITVPTGREIARLTSNSRLGIMGGISILGTTGIVRPYSLSSWKASVVLAVKVAAESGDHVVLAAGSRSREFAQDCFSHEPPERVVEISRFLGPALHMVSIRPQISRVTFVGMIGKLAKVAQGAMDLHTSASALDVGGLIHIAARAGADADMIRTLRLLPTAGAVAEELGEKHPQFFTILADQAKQVIAAKLPAGVSVDIWIVGRGGSAIGHT